jgi:hypothetical protein
MKKGTTPFAAVALCLSASGPGAAFAAEGARQVDCSLKQYASVDIVFDGEDTLLPVTIDGKPAHMVLGLRNAFTTLPRAIVDRLKLATRDISQDTEVFIGGKKIRDATTVGSLRVGGANFGKTAVLVINEPERGDIAGELGWDALGRVDFELDVSHGKLNLYSQEHCPGRVVSWSSTFASVPLLRNPLGVPTFEVELDGKKIRTTLSASLPVTTLSAATSKQLFGFDETATDIAFDAAPASSAPGARFLAMRITAPGLNIANARIGLVRDPVNACDLQRGHSQSSRCAGAQPLVLGRNVIGKLRLYFATKENTLYFTAADPAK